VSGRTTPRRAPGGLRPDPLPRWRGRRPLKRWRYLGVYGEELMACFGDVSIGGVPQAFWAVWDGRALRERTVFRRGRVTVEDTAVRVADGRLAAELELEAAGEPVEVRSPHGAQEIWTRKTPVRVRGAIGAATVDAPGLVDESAGWHARVTRWTWSAGAGVAHDGRAVWWNLVEGVHDAEAASERTVWVGGEAREVDPVAFDGLDGVGGLRFTAEAERARHDRLVLLDSAYRQPFGRFTGVLPDGTVLRSGQGVMERHDVRW
jgi:hypothetical protein